MEVADHADYGLHINLAQVLPFLTQLSPIFTRLGTGTQIALACATSAAGSSVSFPRTLTYGQEESGHQPPTLEWAIGNHSTVPLLPPSVNLSHKTTNSFLNFC